MKETEKKKYPTGTEHYILYEEIGQGVSASVHRALCVPFNEIVAIKILDFERDNCDLNNVSREAQTMILIDHPNVLKSHCSFVSDHNLWFVMPFMAGGSCLHILKAAYPDGFEEVVIATILREALKGLEYLHRHGHIHRDVKAGNILIGADGAIKLGDFGVSACLFDSGDRQRTRNTFVGTPCWMAPEVLEQMHGYDFKADIWSFGITALELAHGHAPFSKYPPMKVLLMTLQSAPPGLDYERDRKFSKSFKQMIAGCLVKDPSKRPTAMKLLKNSFFKQARSNDYIARKILEGLPALGDRMQAIKRKEEDMLAQKRMPDGEMEELSQNEYKRGISSWNFNLEDMKAQASLIQDFDDPISDNSQGGSSSSLAVFDAQDKPSSSQNPSQIPNMPLSNSPEENDELQSQLVSVPVLDSLANDAKFRFEKSNNDCNVTSSSHEHNLSQNSLPRLDEHSEHNSVEKIDMENVGRPAEGIAIHPLHRRGFSSSVLSEASCPSIREESAKLQNQSQNISNCNATSILQIGEDLLSELPSKVSNLSAATSDDTDEKAKIPVVQQRGRFKVTSENVDLEKVGPTPVLQKSQSMQVIASHNPVPLSSLPVSSTSEATSSNVSVNSISKLLHSVLQTNIQQREDILSLMKRVIGSDSTVLRCVRHAVNGACNPAQAAASEKSLLDVAHDRERDLLLEISELQWRLICAQEELEKLKKETT